jgi:hypothetical protein
MSTPHYDSARELDSRTSSEHLSALSDLALCAYQNESTWARRILLLAAETTPPDGPQAMGAAAEEAATRLAKDAARPARGRRAAGAREALAEPRLGVQRLPGTRRRGTELRVDREIHRFLEGDFNNVGCPEARPRRVNKRVCCRPSPR